MLLPPPESGLRPDAMNLSLPVRACLRPHQSRATLCDGGVVNFGLIFSISRFAGNTKMPGVVGKRRMTRASYATIGGGDAVYQSLDRDCRDLQLLQYGIRCRNSDLI